MKNRFESTFYYQEGKMILESEKTPIVVDISYKGVIRGVSELPDGFFIAEGNHRIVIVNFFILIVKSNQVFQFPKFADMLKYCK